ncbi:MAG: GNAT family N-acetyltransferase [Myxococcota bacterium]|nr:GNAT family N-acetyltransferase [Myxococcota bacterium]
MAIELRALTIDDASPVHRICAHAAVARSIGGLPTDGLEGWKKRIVTLPHERSSFVGAFEDGELRGVAMLDGQLRARRRHIAKVWAAVHPDAWGRGIGRQLVGALCEGSDRWWGFVRLELDVHADHAPAIRLYESLGFEREVRKRCDMLRDGEIVDGLHMGRIRPGFVAPPELCAPPEIRARGPRLDARAIVIRPHRADDAESMARLQSSESVMEGTFATPFQSEREWRSRLSGDDGSVRGVVALVDGALAGSAAIFASSSPRIVHAAGFGISVDPDFQGRGVGDALTKACLELADRWMGARRVQLEVYSDNARAQALYRKHGFEPEGVQRVSSFRRGTYADAVVMSRIRAPSPASAS